MKATAKWLVASSSAVVAVVVAGLQLKDLGALSAGQAAGAALCVLVAFGAVVVFLALAARVLVAPHPSLADLLERQRKDMGVAPGPLAKPSDKLLIYLLVDRKLELLGPLRGDLLSLEEERSALTRFEVGGERRTIYGHQLDPANQADQDFVRSRRLELERSINRVLAAAAMWSTKKRYSTLLYAPIQVPLVLAFLGGVIGFGLLTGQQPQSPSLAAPLPVQVVMPNRKVDDHEAAIPAACLHQTVQGVAVGGTIAQPLVVLHPTAVCPALRIATDEHFVVLPEVNRGGTG